MRRLYASPVNRIDQILGQIFEFWVYSRLGCVLRSQMNSRLGRLPTEQVENFTLIQAIERPQT